MTTRRRKEAEGSDLTFHALVGFARGYLHQDVSAEHGDAVAAARAFCAEATPGERHALAADLTRLVARANGWPATTLRDFFATTLRSAWTPRSVAELRAIETVVNDTLGDRPPSRSIR
ncbi:MAG: contact-dependent growth inhibition system immunity protein [Acidobacteriota bacterium]